MSVTFVAGSIVLAEASSFILGLESMALREKIMTIDSMNRERE